MIKEEECGEQSTVVFALIVTEPASKYVYVKGGGGAATPLSRFRNNLCKDDSGFFSRFLYAVSPQLRCLYTVNISKSVEYAYLHIDKMLQTPSLHSVDLGYRIYFGSEAFLYIYM
jgi:hypothetical protein